MQDASQKHGVWDLNIHGIGRTMMHHSWVDDDKEDYKGDESLGTIQEKIYGTYKMFGTLERYNKPLLIIDHSSYLCEVDY